MSPGFLHCTSFRFVQPSANAPLADDGGEWVIPLRSWSLREQVRSLFVAPNKTGRKGPKMKIRNATESIPNHSAARDAAILQDLDLVNRIARRFHRRVPPCVAFDDLASAGMIGLIHAVDRFDQTPRPEIQNLRAAQNLGSDAGFPPR